jgi:predicted Zn-dependent peptidase
LSLEQAFEALGGMVNASTDAETTCYHSRFHPDCLGECVQLFASMLQRPLLSDPEVERRIIMEEALDDFNEQGEEINPDNLTAQLLWPSHPLSRPTIGQRDSLLRIDAEGLRRYHHRHYIPQNTVIAVAGAVNRAQVRAAVESAFGAWSGAAPTSPLSWSETPDGTQGAEIVWVRDSDSQVALQLAFRLPGRNDPRQADLRILRRLLSGGGTSRLMIRLREQLGLTYNIEANLSLYADSGCLTIDLAVTPENLVQAVAEVLGVLKEIRVKSVGLEELGRVVRSYHYDLDFSRDHADDLAMRFGWGEMTANLRTLEDDRRDIAAVQPESLLRTAQELLAAEQLKVAVVGPYAARDCARVTALLVDFGN